MTTQLNLNLAEMRREWLEDSTTYMEGVLAKGLLGDFTTDDLHFLLPDPVQHNWWGALMAKLTLRGRVQEVGRVTSKRKAANGRKVTVWRVAK